MPHRGPTATYLIRTTFRAPLSYVYRWCTDYTPEDPRLEGDDYVRKIVSRKGRTVVYEDLYDRPTGWMWSHQTVTLLPPNRWHAEAMGSHRDWSNDYTLRSLPEGRTELSFVGRRRPKGLGLRNPPRADMERELRSAWKNFASALEKDYRTSGERPAPGERAGGPRR